MILCKGETGTPLRDIISSLGNKNYSFIRRRCKYKNTIGIICDEFLGICSYENGVLTSLDGDTYSLDDLYEEWEESNTYDGTSFSLTVWEYGHLEENQSN